MLRYTLVFIFLFSAIYLPVTLFSQEKTSLTTVVIDAGHGGKDPGTLGKQSQEKNINLGIALKLGGLIRDNCPGVRVIYTRDKDVFIELFERADIANRNHADLFISIHCNSNPTRTLHGAETYVMGLHRTHANLEIAKKENASILMEPNYTANYNGFDPNSDESYITFTMFQNAFLDQSTNFAATVQDQFKDRAGGMDDRGVRQAGFLVLYKTTMPSVLVESGFLSNPEEEKFLMSDNGQEFIASAIFRAFVTFKKRTEAGEKEAVAFNPRSDSQQSPPETSVVKPVPAPKKDPVINKSHNPDPQKKPAVKSSGICFRVQFMLNPKNLSLHSAKFAGLPDVKVYHHQGMYKFTTGEGKSVEDVMKYLDVAKEKGFKDAFIVAFNGEERITIAEAKRLQAGGNR